MSFVIIYFLCSFATLTVGRPTRLGLLGRLGRPSIDTYCQRKILSIVARGATLTHLFIWPKKNMMPCFRGLLFYNILLGLVIVFQATVSSALICHVLNLIFYKGITPF